MSLLIWVNIFYYLGFSLEQIWIAFREYKFNSVEMGVYIMMKDPETKKYNHKFLLRENTFDENNDSFKDNKKINHLKLCAICGEAQIDHTDLNFENEAAKVQNKIIFQSKKLFNCHKICIALDLLYFKHLLFCLTKV